MFGNLEKRNILDHEEDDDPVLEVLRFLDYRYIRFCFHPLKDKFVPCNTWKDPAWRDVRTMRTGLDSDERCRREQVFGRNEIEIQQKSIPQLLIDEVSRTCFESGACLICHRHFTRSMSFKLLA